MKKISFSLALFSALAFAGASSIVAKKYGTAGCGLGSLAFGAKPGMVQIIAATTNGTFGSQTFGITSGTSNCTSDGVLKAEVEQKVYANANYDTLKKEMARGKGESITSLAYLMGCSADSINAFNSVTQKNFSKIFAQDSSDYMLQQVRDIVATDTALTKSCNVAN